MRNPTLRVGWGMTDITPPIGSYMIGGLVPPHSTAIDDPLRSKALVAESQGHKIAIVGVDLALLPRSFCDAAIADASRRTGIDPGAIVICCSHTHSGPDTSGIFFPESLNHAYLATLPGLIADSIEQANATCRPATMAIGRSLVYQGLHHRRVLCKDGKALNTWMVDALDDLQRCPQILGAAGPIDPELWVVRFDSPEGKPLGVLFNYSLHANSHSGQTAFSADYPGVVAEAMRDALGPDVVTVFVAGACGNINPTMGGDEWRAGARYIAEKAVSAARRAQEVPGPVAVGALHRDLQVPRMQPQDQPAGAVERLNWGGGKDFGELFQLARDRVSAWPKEILAPVGALRIGPLGIAAQPGEVFVEDGIAIKRRSPFRHTIIAELANDDIGYQPTRQAFAAEGYEPLMGASRVTAEGIERIVATSSQLLDELWSAG
jgi:neutral ceramidase